MTNEFVRRFDAPTAQRIAPTAKLAIVGTPPVLVEIHPPVRNRLGRFVGRRLHTPESTEHGVQAQEAVEQIKGVLAWCDASGHLYAREQAQEQLTEVIRQLQGHCWKKAKRMLSDARTLRHLDRLPEPWSSAIAEPMLRAALVHLWSLLRRLKQAEGDDRVHWRQWVAMACGLCGRLCPDWQADDVKVDELLSQAVRTSSAIEGVNSVVRMHQGRHRHVSQGMLDLKRLSWHCRAFEGGKRKGRSP
jgi:hypothetical protein